MKHALDASSRWIYRGVWRTLVDLFRVPDQPPDLPVRDGEAIDRFQPATGFLRYQTLHFWIFAVLADLGFTAGYVAIAWACCTAGWWWVSFVLLPIALFIIIVPDILIYIAIHLRYDTTWYVMTDRSLRLRRGIWIIHETTITFENVQNVKLQQGPLQRYFGIANLIVETAGGGAASSHGKGGGASNTHQGVIEGVGNASELRDRILKRLRASKTAGLGDDDHREHKDPVAGRDAMFDRRDHLEALRAIRDEVRLLRAT